ncbi:MAG: ABC transporter permease [Lentisphaeria bacterium]|nr:ABC transporter permease [Lentisphaeria bacterium]
MKRLLSKKETHIWVGMPSTLWLLLFYALPVLIVFVLAFKPVDPYGGIHDGWTLMTLKALGNPVYPAILLRTVWLSIFATLICVLVAVPISYQLCRLSEKLRTFVLLLIIVPFWTNFLIRIYAWKVFLHPDGVFKQILVFLGLIPQETMLLYNQWAVLAVMVYTYLPYAILPVYAAAEKFDFALLDAAKDLGANSFQAFRQVFLPSISRGIWTAVMVVLIPALGAYLIPDLVGGPGSEMIGDKIAQSVFTERNLPQASALSAALMILVFVPLLLILWFRRLAEKAEKSVEKSS